MAYPSYEGRYLGRLSQVSYAEFERRAEARGLTGPDGVGTYAICLIPDDEPPFVFSSTDRRIRARSRCIMICHAPYVYDDGGGEQRWDGSYTFLPLYRRGEPKCDGEGPSWQWDGDEERPTLTPSIGLGPWATDPARGWHGYLRAGRWEGV